jgi:uncharacterized protein YxeA
MKKVLFLMVSMMALVGCTGCKVNVSNWGDGDILEASNNIVTKTYKLAPFEEVTMRCVGEMVLTQDESKDGTVELTAPDNYIDLYKFESNGKKLNVDFAESHINIHTANVKIHVFTSDLTKLRNTGAGMVTIESLDTDSLDLENAGVGSFNLTKVIADEVNVKCTGVGNMTLDGETLSASLFCSGIGNINAQGLKAKTVEAKLTGVGSISCFASESIDGHVTGVGSLKYAGHPKHKNLDKNLTGGISEI